MKLYKDELFGKSVKKGGKKGMTKEELQILEGIR